MTTSGAQQGIRPGVCLSTSRPASPYIGQIIYMTDVNQSAVWNGTSWEGLDRSRERNVIINGAMQIFQRGTSFTSLGFTSYTADRMFFFCGININRTVTRQNTSDTTNLPNFFFCTRVQRTAAATDLNTTNISQSFESSDSVRLSGKSVTFSFYARAGANFSGASSGLSAVVRSGTGADQNIAYGFTGSTNVIASSATLTTTWQRFTFTGPVAATATQLGWILGFDPVGTAGANDYFEVTGVQLEAGSVATPFEFENYGTTLAKCQRYYYRNSAVNAGGLYSIFGVGQGDTTTNVEGYIPFPVAMRTAPNAIDVTATASNYAFYGATVVSALTSVPVFASSNSNIYAQGVSFRSTSNATVGRAYQLLANNNNTAYIGFSAEL